MKTNGFLEPNSKTSAPSAGELKPRRDVRHPPKKEKNHEKSKESKHECLATYSRGGANTNFACPKEALINSSENWLHTLP